jgi:hypothetical protein
MGDRLAAEIRLVAWAISRRAAQPIRLGCDDSGRKVIVRQTGAGEMAS